MALSAASGSGIYLTVFDETNVEDPSEVLRTTKGGPPHITLAYSGRALSCERLRGLLRHALDLAVPSFVTLESAQLSSFTDRDGNARHDVLLVVGGFDIGRLRGEVFGGIAREDPVLYAKLVMREPHVTVGIYRNLADAEARLEAVGRLLPRVVTICGVSM